MSGPATPHTSQPATGTATPSLPSTLPQLSQPPAPAMPPASDFDILPDLHKLLARIYAQPLPGQAVKSEKDGPLDMRDLAGEATAVKRKMQRVREKVMALPDIERSLEDQDEEIAELEERIEMLKGRLRELGRERDERVENEDTSMLG